MTSTHFRMALAGLRWTLDDLAHQSGISRITVARHQSGQKVGKGSVDAMQKALESAGATFRCEPEKVIVSVPLNCQEDGEA